MRTFLANVILVTALLNHLPFNRVTIDSSLLNPLSLCTCSIVYNEGILFINLVLSHGLTRVKILSDIRCNINCFSLTLFFLLISISYRYLLYSCLRESPGAWFLSDAMVKQPLRWKSLSHKPSGRFYRAAWAALAGPDRCK